MTAADATTRYDPFCENAFGAARVCAAMKAPVGLLSGERSASADGGALPRQALARSRRLCVQNLIAILFAEDDLAVESRYRLSMR